MPALAPQLAPQSWVWSACWSGVPSREGLAFRHQDVHFLVFLLLVKQNFLQKHTAWNWWASNHGSWLLLASLSDGQWGSLPGVVCPPLGVRFHVGLSWRLSLEWGLPHPSPGRAASWASSIRGEFSARSVLAPFWSGNVQERCSCKEADGRTMAVLS